MLQAPTEIPEDRILLNPKMITRLFLLILTGLVITNSLGLLAEDQPKPLPQALKFRLEALSRIDPKLYQRSDEIAQLVNQIAEALKKRPELVDLVTRFELRDQTASLLEIASQHPESPAAAKALDYVLATAPADELTGTAAKDPNLLLLLARNGSSQALDLLLPIVKDPNTEPDFRRSLVQTACQKKTAANRIYQWLSEASPADKTALVPATLTALNQTPWEDLRSQFRALSDSAPTASASPQRDIAALVKLPGDATRGRTLFLNPQTTCISCHRIGEDGKDLGPGLSDIGKKLGKDALFDAILNPSAGISFDYEGWEITLNSGDELIGILQSQTETEITIRDLIGQTTTVSVEDIFERRKMSTSIMPGGLGEVIPEQDLVDLVAYLSTLGH